MHVNYLGVEIHAKDLLAETMPIPLLAAKKVTGK